ncbi:unnamed protein product, partial [Didymodactylos carnosus]
RAIFSEQQLAQMSPCVDDLTQRLKPVVCEFAERANPADRANGQAKVSQAFYNVFAQTRAEWIKSGKMDETGNLLGVTAAEVFADIQATLAGSQPPPSVNNDDTTTAGQNERDQNVNIDA